MRKAQNSSKRWDRDMFKQPLATNNKLVLSNALYFNASWEYEFDSDFSIPAAFNTFTSTLNITLMDVELDLPHYQDTTNNGFHIISLPYEHDLNNTGTSEAHMFLIQPTNGTKEGFEALERKLPSVDFEAVFKKMKIEFGNILLPRMKMEFSQNLQPHFSRIERLFSGNPSKDFSPITDSWSELKLDTLQHKAVIRLTEKGTEAAAATATISKYSAFRPTVNIKFDRPFFFFIYDALNKVVIFWGRVVQPEPL